MSFHPTRILFSHPMFPVREILSRTMNYAVGRQLGAERSVHSAHTVTHTTIHTTPIIRRNIRRRDLLTMEQRYFRHDLSHSGFHGRGFFASKGFKKVLREVTCVMAHGGQSIIRLSSPVDAPRKSRIFGCHEGWASEAMAIGVVS